MILGVRRPYLSLHLADLLTVWNLPFDRLESGPFPKASEFPDCVWSLPPTDAGSQTLLAPHDQRM